MKELPYILGFITGYTLGAIIFKNGFDITLIIAFIFGIYIPRIFKIHEPTIKK
jgi:hypothetical protein